MTSKAGKALYLNKFFKKSLFSIYTVVCICMHIWLNIKISTRQVASKKTKRNRCHTSRHCHLAIFCWHDRLSARSRPVFSNALSSLKHGFCHMYKWRHIRKHRRTIVHQKVQAAPLESPQNKNKNCNS